MSLGIRYTNAIVVNGGAWCHRVHIASKGAHLSRLMSSYVARSYTIVYSLVMSPMPLFARSIDSFCDHNAVGPPACARPCVCVLSICACMFVCGRVCGKF